MTRWISLGLVLAALANRSTAQEADRHPPEELPPVSAQLPGGGAAPATECGPIFESTRVLDDSAPRIWASADYLMWWTKRAGLPPLVVTGSENDLFPGALDQPGTRILFGDKGLGYGTFNGLRLGVGGWIGPDRRFGVEASGFLLEHRTATFSTQGDANGQPFLAAPFSNALTGNQNVYFIAQNFANPALSAMLTGGVAVTSSSNLWSWELNGVANAVRTNFWTIDVLGGFRQASLRENLSYVTTAVNLAPGGASIFLLNPVAPGFVVTTFDDFVTHNTFNGGQFGVRAERRWGRFGIATTLKLAMGSMHEVANIGGQTSTNAPLPVTVAPGGIYAQPSNIGSYSRDMFAVVPEFGLNLTFQIRPNVKAWLGYTFVYFSNVARPGDQIDTQININQVPIDAAFGTPGGPARPAFNWQGTGFWAQGINFGMEITY